MSLTADRQLARAIFRPGTPAHPEPARTLPPPWAVMPPDGEQFDYSNSIEAPPADGNDALVLSFRAPVGHRGILKGIGHFYVGSGFVEGSGAILWRIRVNGRLLRGYNAIPIQMGSGQLARPLEGGFFFESHDLVEYLVNVPVSSPVATGAGNYMVAMLTGWTWPVRTAGRV